MTNGRQPGIAGRLRWVRAGAAACSGRRLGGRLHLHQRRAGNREFRPVRWRFRGSHVFDRCDVRIDRCSDHCLVVRSAFELRADRIVDCRPERNHVQVKADDISVVVRQGHIEADGVLDESCRRRPSRLPVCLPARSRTGKQSRVPGSGIGTLTLPLHSSDAPKRLAAPAATVAVDPMLSAGYSSRLQNSSRRDGIITAPSDIDPIGGHLSTGETPQ